MHRLGAVMQRKHVKINHIRLIRQAHQRLLASKQVKKLGQETSCTECDFRDDSFKFYCIQDPLGRCPECTSPYLIDH